MTTKTNGKTSVHTIYRTKNGEKVPSVTTVLGILAKPALIDWAWKLGIAGQDYRKVRDGAGDIGTLAHHLIMSHLRGEKPDVSEYSPADLDKAETCLLKYWEWEKVHQLRPALVEVQAVSEQYEYGGTIDLVAMTPDKQAWLVDHKTGKGIYPEMVYQLAAYRHLLAEVHGMAVDSCMILRIGRDPGEGFEEREFGPDELGNAFDIFKHCLAIWNLRRP